MAQPGVNFALNDERFVRVPPTLTGGEGYRFTVSSFHKVSQRKEKGKNQVSIFFHPMQVINISTSKRIMLITPPSAAR